VSEIIIVDRKELVVRPIRVSDVERLARMFGRLSPESIRYRFFSPLPRLSAPALRRLAEVDGRHRDALVALDGDEIVAVARYSEIPESTSTTREEAEIAVTVEDAWQRRGLGRRLARRLAVRARGRGYKTFIARMLADNRAALGLVRDLVPDASVVFAGGDYEARLPLATMASEGRSDDQLGATDTP